MLMKMRSKMQNQKGFTLVELMVVVVILGILVAIAVPIYNNVTVKAAKSAHDANARTLVGAATTAVATEGLPAADVTWNALTSLSPNGNNTAADYVQKWPTVPKGLTNADAAYVVTITTTGTITCAPGIGEY